MQHKEAVIVHRFIHFIDILMKRRLGKILDVLQYFKASYLNEFTQLGDRINNKLSLEIHFACEA